MSQFLGLIVLVAVSAVVAVQPPAATRAGPAGPPLPDTLIYAESEADLPAILEAHGTASQVLTAQVSAFYPTMGQSTLGSCWMGLMIDSNDNVYPINASGVYKILPDGTLVNGVDDSDLFAIGGFSFWGTLDERNAKLYSAAGSNVRSAPFLKGSTFSVLTSGLNVGEAVALGQGPLDGSLVVTETANQVSRVTLSPLGVSVFASGTSFFNRPEAIASAPDGTLYVVNVGSDPAQLTKITPAGVPSIFLTGSDRQTNRAVVVDDAGGVYWSHAAGIDKYDAGGVLLGTLPGPPDSPAYGNPLGAAFDSDGNLYILENFGCKKIYKYTFPPDVVGGLAVDLDGGLTALPLEAAQASRSTAGALAALIAGVAAGVAVLGSAAWYAQKRWAR